MCTLVLCHLPRHLQTSDSTQAPKLWVQFFGERNFPMSSMVTLTNLKVISLISPLSWTSNVWAMVDRLSRVNVIYVPLGRFRYLNVPFEGSLYLTIWILPTVRKHIQERCFISLKVSMCYAHTSLLYMCHFVRGHISKTHYVVWWGLHHGTSFQGVVSTPASFWNVMAFSPYLKGLHIRFSSSSLLNTVLLWFLSTRYFNHFLRLSWPHT